jgi:predicted dehydrogenase
VKPNLPLARRGFLKASAGTLAAASAWPAMVASRSAQAAPAPAKPAAPSERLVIGMIGTGDLGRRHHLEGKILSHPNLDCVAVCDVDSHHVNLAARSIFNKTGKRPGVYHDFRKLLDRKDLDAVFVVTPDHWHALCAIAAVEAGKDVYCEKPLTLTVDEGRKMVATARRYGSVLQTGNMQRSDARFRHAVELVRNERIGKVKTIHTYIGSVHEPNWEPLQTPPSELDWDLWLGPAPWADYFPGRCHYEFRWFSEYSGGKMTDWGAHHNDQAQWALDMDSSGPVFVEGKGVRFEKGPYNVFKTFDVHYRYANGVDLFCHGNGPNGVRYEGTDGWIFVSRSKIEASDPAILEWEPGANDKKVINTGSDPDNWTNHYGNWIDCIKTRQRPICDVEVGHRSASLCHLGNIAMTLGRPLQWDPAKEQFEGDEAANALLSRPMRAPWKL